MGLAFLYPEPGKAHRGKSAQAEAPQKVRGFLSVDWSKPAPFCVTCASLHSPFVMGLAFLYPEPEKTAPGKKSKVATVLDYKSVGATRFSQARSVLRHSREKGGRGKKGKASEFSGGLCHR
jgi:hypothetical protein